MAKAAHWTGTDAEARKRAGGKTGSEQRCQHDVIDLRGGGIVAVRRPAAGDHHEAVVGPGRGGAAGPLGDVTTSR